jgi:hypothetical protein
MKEVPMAITSGSSGEAKNLANPPRTVRLSGTPRSFQAPTLPMGERKSATK